MHLCWRKTTTIPRSDSLQLDQLMEIAESYDTQQKFLSDFAIEPKDGVPRQMPKNPNNADDYTVLSTISLGQGARVADSPDFKCTDGCIPLTQADDVEEERRLLHVAMTRAKNELDLVVPRRFLRPRQKVIDYRTYGATSRLIPVPIRARSLPVGGGAKPLDALQPADVNLRITAFRLTQRPVDLCRVRRATKRSKL